MQRKQLTPICDGTWDGLACIDELQANQNLGLSLFYQPTSVVNAGWHLAYFLPTKTIVDIVRMYGESLRNVVIATVPHAFLIMLMLRCTATRLRRW